MLAFSMITSLRAPPTGKKISPYSEASQAALAISSSQDGASIGRSSQRPEATIAPEPFVIEAENGEMSGSVPRSQPGGQR
jgi:hypothetical protein